MSNYFCYFNDFFCFNKQHIIKRIKIYKKLVKTYLFMNLVKIEIYQC